MLTRKKPIKSRTRRARGERSKFLTPDLALFRGQKLRFVAGPDDPLRQAERVRGGFAQMVARHHAEVRQFLQQAYGVALQFRQRRGDFERLQVHPFWKQTGMKPRDPSTSKWVLYLIMQATTPDMGNRADQYAVILDGLKQEQVEASEVAARLQELGGIGPRTKPCGCGSAEMRELQPRLRLRRRPRSVAELADMTNVRYAR